MPYIVQDKRDVLDSAIKTLVNALRELECDDSSNSMAGNINYVISRIMQAAYSTKYDDINEVVGILECVKQEYYRRVAAPYENQKAFENGDVFEQ